MAKKLPELERRRVASEKTRAKYLGKEFDWKARRTCIHLAAFQAKQMGHKPPPVANIRSALSAKKELQKRECKSVIELLDKHFQRIPPAMMRLGDLCAFEGTEGLDGVMVNVGPCRAMGWHEDAPSLAVLVFEPTEVAAAWRL